MLFAKGIRVVMRGAGSGLRYGIKGIKANTQDQTAMFIEKSERKVPRCWSTAENNFNVVPRPHILMDCMHALEQNDSREIYLLQEYEIQQWADKKCVGMIDETGQKTKGIGSISCTNSEANKFVIHENGQVIQKQDGKMCIVAGEDPLIKNIQEFGVVDSSAMQNSSEIDAYSALKHEGSSKYWASQLGLKTAFYQINFDREYLVKRLKIEWVFPPKLFELKFMMDDGQWESELREAPTGMKTEIVFNAKQVKGIKLMFLEADATVMKANNGKATFGFKKLQLQRPGIPLLLGACDSKDA